MSSQGGRASYWRRYVCDHWKISNPRLLLDDYLQKDISKFIIAGVGIPTASTIMRFMYPNDFGVIDSRVTNFSYQNM